MTAKRTGPLIIPQTFRDTKDPCPVFDGNVWHIYGSAGTVITETWEILHATAPTIEGPWTLEKPAKLKGVSGPRFCAPGVIFDEKLKIFHMFVHTDFTTINNSIEHLASKDGKVFTHVGTPLKSLPGTREAGIYDPHPAIIKNKDGEDRLYIVYSGYPDGQLETNRTDICLAKSTTHTWNGPWARIGPILRQENISNHHNQHDDPGFEWGMEGAQLMQLPNGKILLNAVCFLPEGIRGTRQRVFFAIADHVLGPYKTLGPVLSPSEVDEWESGENGHAAGVIVGDKLYLFYQARGLDMPWRYGIATFNVRDFEKKNLFDKENLHKVLHPKTIITSFTQKVRNYAKLPS